MSASNLSMSEQLAFSTVRIETKYHDGSSGSGTGFFYAMNDDGKSHIPVIVTNKHVVANTKIGLFRMTLSDNDGNPVLGKTENIVLENFTQLWFFHPDPEVDIAVMPIAPLLSEVSKRQMRVFYRSLDKSLIPTSQEKAEYNYVEDVLMVGYPIGIQDVANNMPIFRRGITATHLHNDYNGRKEFVIDAACFPGSSGSPVLLYNVPYYVDKKGNTTFQNRVKLIGVLYAGPQYDVEGEIVIKDIPVKSVPASRSSIPTNLGYVIKADRLVEMEKLFNRP